MDKTSNVAKSTHKRIESSGIDLSNAPEPVVCFLPYHKNYASLKNELVKKIETRPYGGFILPNVLSIQKDAFITELVQETQQCLEQAKYEVVPLKFPLIGKNIDLPQELTMRMQEVLDVSPLQGRLHDKFLRELHQMNSENVVKHTREVIQVRTTGYEKSRVEEYVSGSRGELEAGLNYGLLKALSRIADFLETHQSSIGKEITTDEKQITNRMEYPISSDLHALSKLSTLINNISQIELMLYDPRVEASKNTVADLYRRLLIHENLNKIRQKTSGCCLLIPVNLFLMLFGWFVHAAEWGLKNIRLLVPGDVKTKLSKKIRLFFILEVDLKDENREEIVRQLCYLFQNPNALFLIFADQKTRDMIEIKTYTENLS